MCQISICLFWNSVALCVLIIHSWCQYTYSIQNVPKFGTLLAVCPAGDEVSPSSLMQPSQPLVKLSTNVENHTVARGLHRFGIENRPPSIADVSGEQLHFPQDVVRNLCCRVCMRITLHACYLLFHIDWSTLIPIFFMLIWWMTDQW